MATLIAHWDFDGATDKSGNGHTLVHAGGVSTITRPFKLTGVANNSFDVPTLKSIPNTFSLFIDVVLSNRTDGQALLALNADSYDNLFVVGLYGGCLDRRIRTTSPTNYSSANLPIGTRVQIALTYQASGSTTLGKLYIDGVEQPSAAFTYVDLLATDATTKPFSIGQEWDGATRTDFANATLYDVKVFDGLLTAQEIFDLGYWNNLTVVPFRQTCIPANQEPRSAFQPQDVAWVGGEGKGYAGPVNANPLDPVLLCAGLDRYWLRDGVQDVLQGYIESTVTINGEGVARRVLCFDQAGNLVGETMSRASDGKYRFDLLWLNRRYMLVAQDDPAFGPADYNAVAADFQLPTPYAPGEGVGLA